MGQIPVTQYEIVEFIVRCQNWLIPLGYVEIFKDNHPSIADFNIHFIKDGIRVQCRKRYSREECHLSGMTCSIDKQVPLTISTGNYEIGTTELDKLHDVVNHQIDYCDSIRKINNEKN